MRYEVVPAFALAVLLVAAGCTGPADTGQTTTTALAADEAKQQALDAEERRVSRVLENRPNVTDAAVATDGDPSATLLNRSGGVAYVRVEMPYSYAYDCDAGSGNVDGVRTHVVYRVTAENASLAAIDRGIGDVCPADGELRESPLIEYSELSNESRRAVQFLLRQGSAATREPLFGPEIAERHYNVIYVQYDGSVVTIRHQVRTEERRVCLRTAAAVDEADVPDGGAVGNYSALPPEAQDLFRAVVEGNASGVCYAPDDYPLLDYNYVEYRGDYYALDELQGTTTVHHYRVRNVTDGTSSAGE